MIVGKRETSVFALRAMAAPGARTLTSTPPRGAAHTARSLGRWGAGRDAAQEPPSAGDQCWAGGTAGRRLRWNPGQAGVFAERGHLSAVLPGGPGG